jgi:hypothetical protein
MSIAAILRNRFVYLHLRDGPRPARALQNPDDAGAVQIRRRKEVIYDYKTNDAELGTVKKIQLTEFPDVKDEAELEPLQEPADHRSR